MDKVISMKDLIVLLQRQNGKTTELIDIISNHLYNESNKTYGVIVVNSYHGFLLIREIRDAASFMGVKFLVDRKTMLKSDRDVTIMFYTTDSVRNIQGISFDDVYFDDPRSFITIDVVENIFHRIKNENRI